MDPKLVMDLALNGLLDFQLSTYYLLHETPDFRRFAKLTKFVPQ